MGVSAHVCKNGKDRLSGKLSPAKISRYTVVLIDNANIVCTLPIFKLEGSLVFLALLRFVVIGCKSIPYIHSAVGCLCCIVIAPRCDWRCMKSVLLSWHNRDKWFIIIVYSYMIHRTLVYHALHGTFWDTVHNFVTIHSTNSFYCNLWPSLQQCCKYPKVVECSAYIGGWVHACTQNKYAIHPK